MGKEIWWMTLEEALDALERLLQEDGYSADGYDQRQKLYAHILELFELKIGGDG